MRGKSVHLELVQGWLTGKVWELNYGNNKNGSTTNDGDGDGTTTSWTLVRDFEKKRKTDGKDFSFPDLVYPLWPTEIPVLPSSFIVSALRCLKLVCVRSILHIFLRPRLRLRLRRVVF
ncbi:hypothetical protein F8388_024200 [Cannabis sativa]|uniref:Uncharacterized protein n=1 Tax=Cannabis sativa TaxID=3483 RepID=A0A7J6E0E0_CANSA|nr:hypothetical protein F8388_024200 [Cannabis sativa]